MHWFADVCSIVRFMYQPEVVTSHKTAAVVFCIVTTCCLHGKGFHSCHFILTAKSDFAHGADDNELPILMACTLLAGSQGQTAEVGFVSSRWLNHWPTQPIKQLVGNLQKRPKLLLWTTWHCETKCFHSAILGFRRMIGSIACSIPQTLWQQVPTVHVQSSSRWCNYFF